MREQDQLHRERTEVMATKPVVTSGKEQLADAAKAMSAGVAGVATQTAETVAQGETSPPAATAVDPATNGGAVVEAKSTEVAEGFFAPADMEALSGAGQENVTTANTLLPRLTILQSLSPQIKKAKVEYIEGAEEGDWCEVGTGEIFKGEVEVLPCFFATQYIQWKKNRGGFVANLGMDASCLKDTVLNEKRQNILPNGDSISETATWYCLLHVGYDWRRVFLSFTSTGLKSSRKWLTLIRAEKLLGKGGLFTPPMFYRPWILKVAHDSNDQGDWYTAVPQRSERAAEDITTAQPDRYKTIYHLMAEMNDMKWLLNEAKSFYADARDNLVIGDLASEDPNDPANARVAGSSSTDNRQIDNSKDNM